MNRIRCIDLICIILFVGPWNHPAHACDDILAALIGGRDHQTQFDVDLEHLSSGLNEVIAAGQEPDWDKAQKRYRDGVLKPWFAIYKDYLRAPPPSLASHPNWTTSLETLSGLIASVRKALGTQSYESLHGAVFELQHSLVQTYMSGWAGSAPAAAASLMLPIQQARRQLADHPRVHPTTMVFLMSTLKDRLETVRAMPAGMTLETLSTPIMTELEDLSSTLKSTPRGTNPTALTGRLENLEAMVNSYRSAFLVAATEVGSAPSPSRSPESGVWSPEVGR